jgi:hypothetical protein
MMNVDGAELMKDGQRWRTVARPVWTGRMADGEASEGSQRNPGKLLCGSGGVECIFCFS